MTHYVRWNAEDEHGVYAYASVHMPHRQALAVAAQKTSEGARNVRVIPVL